MKNTKRTRGTNSTDHLSAKRWPLRALIEGLESRRLLSTSVLTSHNDAARTGWNPTEVSLTPANVNTSTFGQAFSYPVQGQVYAQPLYVPGLTIPGKGVHDVVLVATENNDVYAFDANSNAGVGAGLLWHVNLGLAAVTPNAHFGNRYGPFHDIVPQVGITGTPVIDPTTNTLYVDAFTNDVAGQDAYSHRIYALDITTGANKTAPVVVAASVRGTGVGGNGTTITFEAKRQLQRPALNIFNGVLYVAFAGYADTDPYHGWVLGYNPSDLKLVSAFSTTPNAGTDDYEGEGGIWQSGGGLSSDGTRMYFETGNGDFEAAAGNYGDSVLSVIPDTSTAAAPNINGYGLRVTDYFTPYNEQALADADADLGSGSAMVLPDQAGPRPHLMVAVGKQGIIYLINRDDMGQFSPTTDRVVQKISLGHAVFGSPAYFNSSVYYHANSDALKRFSLTNGLLSAAPAAQATVGVGSQSATPSISSNGNANGIVWEVQWNGTHEILRAYDATTLAELYNSNQNVSRDQLGVGVKFITPTIADGHVFVGSADKLSVFTLLTPPTTPPAAPSNLVASAPTTASVELSWVDNANNEGGFKIERSLNNTTFTQIGIASAGSTRYTDENVAANTLYYYRIRATNAIGDSAFTAVASVTTPVSTGPVNVYRFDAGSGTTAADSAGTNTGTLIGTPLPTWTTGRIGAKALTFSGNGLYNQATAQSSVRVANNFSPILGSTSTLAAWVKTTQVGSDTHWRAPAITGSEAAGSDNDINWGTLDDTGRIGIFVGDNGGLFSSNPVNDGQWHHIAMTRNATTGRVQLYVDGVLNGAITLEAGNKTATFNIIGGLNVVAGDGTTRTGGNYFNGSLDEVRVYNGVLSANEVGGMAIVPTAPNLLSATVATGPVSHLTFSNTSDYTRNLVIERKTGATGTYATIATLAANATVYDDENVVPGTQYYYRVRATNLAGTSAPSNERSVTPAWPRIVNRQIFYNGSSYDGQNGSSDFNDVAAIAPDKQALLPGQSAAFQNYTSYSKGINGILIDIADLVTLPRIDDFEFAVGNDNSPSGWSIAPTPALINTYPGRGINGSTQITIIWNDNVIQNQWLRVTVVAEPHLGLQTNDVFYFGNAIGETGNSTTDAAVDSADELRTRNNGTGLGTAAITNVYDFNRDKRVDTQDQLIARSKRSGLNPLRLISAPAARAGAPKAGGSGMSVAGSSTGRTGVTGIPDGTASPAARTAGVPATPTNSTENGLSAVGTSATLSAATSRGRGTSPFNFVLPSRPWTLDMPANALDTFWGSQPVTTDLLTQLGL